jgi:hypothetical protein
MRKLVIVVLFCLVLFSGNVVFAAHPLITDDTGTQGKGKFQFEVNGQYDGDQETKDGISVKTTGGQMAGALSYGLNDTIDIVLGLPYQWNKVREDSVVISNEHGVSDSTFEVKWRLYEKDGLSFAIKPGVMLPFGDENKGLGSGKISYSTFLITTKEMGPWAFHFNVGYILNKYKLPADEDANRKDIWHASLASQVEIVKNMKIVANIGVESNSDKTSNTDPGFVLVGVIYSIAENFDVDMGIKAGLNKTETDYTALAGIAWRF